MAPPQSWDYNTILDKLCKLEGTQRDDLSAVGTDNSGVESTAVSTESCGDANSPCLGVESTSVPAGSVDESYAVRTSDERSVTSDTTSNAHSDASTPNDDAENDSHDTEESLPEIPSLSSGSSGPKVKENHPTSHNNSSGGGENITPQETPALRNAGSDIGTSRRNTLSGDKAPSRPSRPPSMATGSRTRATTMDPTGQAMRPPRPSANPRAQPLSDAAAAGKKPPPPPGKPVKPPAKGSKPGPPPGKPKAPSAKPTKAKPPPPPKGTKAKPSGAALAKVTEAAPPKTAIQGLTAKPKPSTPPPKRRAPQSDASPPKPTQPSTSLAPPSAGEPLPNASAAPPVKSKPPKLSGKPAKPPAKPSKPPVKPSQTKLAAISSVPKSDTPPAEVAPPPVPTKTETTLQPSQTLAAPSTPVATQSSKDKDLAPSVGEPATALSYPPTLVEAVQESEPSGIPSADVGTTSAPPTDGEFGVYVCVADFVADQDGDLDLKVGDLVTVTDQADPEWFRGRMDSREGIFPASFVEKQNVPPNAVDTAPVPTKYRCVYDFPGEQDGDLSLTVGDIVTLTNVIDSEWMEGEVDGRSGTFPAGFVELDSGNSGSEEAAGPSSSHENVNPEPTNPTPSVSSPDIVQLVRCIADFAADQDGDLALTEGEIVAVIEVLDDAWLRGSIDDRTGIFPVTFVEDYSKPTDAESAIALSAVSGSGPELFRCIADFAADQEGDLSLKEGEVITLLERIDDDWMRGETSGQEGIFPMTFVEPYRVPSTVSLSNTSGHDNSGYAVCVTAFSAEQEGDLALTEGDEIVITKRIDEDWLEGESNGRTGVFPRAFVDVQVDIS